MDNRIVIVDDACTWLSQWVPQSTTSFIGSLPDYSEFPQLSLSQWQEWFTYTAELILEKTSDEGVTFFFQSDIKVDGYWIDKAFLCQLAAKKLNRHLVFHKIFCRTPVGKATFGRPAYSHLLCFTKNLKINLEKSTPDVIENLGDKTWERGTGLEACMTMAKFIKEQTQSELVINPFCGHGSILAALEYCGLNSIGIEKSRKRALKAEQVKVSSDGKSFINL